MRKKSLFFKKYGENVTNYLNNQKNKNFVFFIHKQTTLNVFN